MLKPLPPDSACPINVLLDIISAKWTAEIMRELALHPTRTRKFLLHIPGLSMKALCRRLQTLEEAGLINRQEYPGKSLKVEYSLTPHGRRLCAIFEDLKSLEEQMNNNCLSCVCSMEQACINNPSKFNCPHRRIKEPKAGS
ncbi:MAG: helix-turn-helix transcriptional regulator [Candidatus Obscuribacterales bacterium]|nr:helix-turn-helix transcriptional regulator [Candidatus Obscuribacterales bacterium]